MKTHDVTQRIYPSSGLCVKHRRITMAFLFLLSAMTLFGQDQESRIAREIASHDAVFKSLQASAPLFQLNQRTQQTNAANQVVADATFFATALIILGSLLDKKG